MHIDQNRYVETALTGAALVARGYDLCAIVSRWKAHQSWYSGARRLFRRSRSRSGRRRGVPEAAGSHATKTGDERKSRCPSKCSVLAGHWCSRSTRAATDFADCKNVRRLRQRTMICKFVSPSHVILSR